MSSVIEAAVAALQEKVPDGFDGIVKFVVAGEGTIIIDRTGVRAADEEAGVTLTADAAVFKAILDGKMNPMAAFMSGKLTVDGSMALAIKLGSVLS